MLTHSRHAHSHAYDMLTHTLTHTYSHTLTFSPQQVLGSGTTAGAGHWAQALQAYIMGWLPTWLIDIILVKVSSQLRADFLKNE